MPALADRPGSPAGRWSDLGKRTLSAALLAPLALLCIWLGAAGWTLLVAAAAVLLGFEWAALCGLRPLGNPGLGVPLALVCGGAAAVLGLHAFSLVVLAVAAALLWALRGWRVGLGVLYLGIPVLALVWLRGDDAAGRADVLFVVAVVWASDIGAYLVGRVLGGPKLAPAISPGKTWSGAIGGVLLAMLAGELVARALAAAPPGRAAAIALALGIASVCGDLFESWIKRRFGVKDSGRLIPGHGGLLDRLDGLLAAAPVAALMALAQGREGVLWR